MTATHKQVTVEGGGVALPGDLTVPDDPSGLVLFAHGSGSSRRSPRNQAVAASLNEAGIGTLLFDLLTADEERLDARTAELRFDIALLARRLTMAVDWLDGNGVPAGRPPRPGGSAARRRARARPADRRRCGRSGAPAQRGDSRRPAWRQRPGGRAWCEPPVRGARCPRPGRDAGSRLVHPALARLSRHFPDDIARFLVVAQALEAGVAQLAVIGPLGEGDLTDEPWR